MRCDPHEAAKYFETILFSIARRASKSWRWNRSLAPLTSRWLAEYLYQVRATDTATYLVTIGFTITACAAAALLAARPVRRADLGAVLREQ